MIEFLLVPAAVTLAFGLQIRDMTRIPKVAAAPTQAVTHLESPAYRQPLHAQPTLYHRLPQPRHRQIGLSAAEFKAIVSGRATVTQHTNGDVTLTLPDHL